MKFLVDWIDSKLDSTDTDDALGEEFMEPEGTTKKFILIWETFFTRMVDRETMGLIERLQYGLKIRREPERIQQCLEFSYGIVRLSHV